MGNKDNTPRRRSRSELKAGFKALLWQTELQLRGGDSKQSKQWKASMEIKSFNFHSRKGNMITIEPSTSSSRQR
ncbi:hypothetical protein ACLOJK_026748 [Asimina triloba]